MIVKRMFWPCVDRAKPARAPSALHQEQVALLNGNMLSGLERSDRNK